MDSVGGRVVWNFDADLSKFDRGVSDAKRKVNSFAQETAIATKAGRSNISGFARGAQTSFGNVASSLTTLAKRMAIVGVAAGGLGAVFLKQTSDFEQSRIAFETMLGSADAARKMLKELSDFAVKTPFQLPDVVKGAKQLLAYGIAAEDILPDFKALGEVAAGVGTEKLPFLTLAFGQVATKGKLAGQEIRQFTEAGVPLVQTLADTFGKTTQEIQEMSEAGDISFEMVRTALHSMSEEGGRFFNLMDRQSKTFGGVVSNIQDQLGRVARAVLGISEEGDIRQGSVFEKLSNAAKGLLDFLDNNVDSITKFFETIISFGDEAVAVLGAFAAALITAKIGAFVAGLIAFIPQIGIFITSVKAGAGVVTALNVAMLANPAGLIVAGVVSLVAALTFLQIRFGLVTKALRALEPVVRPIIDLFKGLWDAVKLLITGDFTGQGLFGLSEDSPVVDFILRVREGFLVIANIVKKVLMVQLKIYVAYAKVMIKAYKKVFEGFKKGVESIAKLIEPAVAFFVDTWDKAFESIKTIVTELRNIIEPVFKKIADTLKPIIESIGDFFVRNKAVIVNVMKAIGFALAIIVAAPVIKAVAIFLALFKALSLVLGFVADNFDIIKKVVGTVLKLAIAPFVIGLKITIALVKGLKKAFDIGKAAAIAVKDAIVGFISFALEPLKAIIDILIDTFNKLKDAFFFMKDVFEAVLSGDFGAVKDLFVNLFGDIKDAVVNKISEMVTGIGDKMNNLKDSFTDKVGDIKDAAVEKFESIKESFTDVVSDIPGALKSGFETLRKKVENSVGGVVEAAVDKFNEIKDGVKDAILNLPTTIKNAIETLRDKIGKYIEKIKEDFTKGFDVDINEVKSKMTTIGKAIGIALLAIFVALPLLILGALVALVVFIGVQLLRIVAVIIQWGVQLLAAIGGVLLQVTGAVIGFFVNLITSILGFLASILASVLGFFGNLLATFIGGLASIIGSVIKFGAQLLATIAGAIAGVIAAFVAFGAKLIGIIASTLAKGIGAIIQFGKDIINHFAGAINWLVQAGKNIVKGLIDGIKSLAQGVWNAIKEVADQIGDFFEGAATWLFDAGKAIIGGLIDGIKSAAGAVKDAVGSVLEGARNLLPFSPAKEGPFSGRGWTLHSGRSISKALAMGIKDNASMVTNATRSLASGAVSGIGSEIDALTGSPVRVIGQNEINGGGGRVENNIGEINIGNEVDAENWLLRLTREDEVIRGGLTPSV